MLLPFAAPPSTHCAAAVFFPGYASPAVFLVSTVHPPLITRISPASAAPASTLTIIGDNFFALGPCEVLYTISFPSNPIESSRCNVTSTQTVEFTLAASSPAAAIRSVKLIVYFLPPGKGVGRPVAPSSMRLFLSLFTVFVHVRLCLLCDSVFFSLGKYPSPLGDITADFNIIGTLMSAQLVVSPKVSRQNTTLFITLSAVTTGVSISFISISSLPSLISVASSTCTINGQPYADVVTASRPHHDHLVLEFASAISPTSPMIVCAVGVQFQDASSSKVVNITTDIAAPARGLSSTTVDACSAAAPSLSGMTASVSISPPAAGQQTSTLALSLTGLAPSAPIRFISIASLPSFSSPSIATCFMNGDVLRPVASVTQQGTLLLELAAAAAPNSTSLDCSLFVLFNASGFFPFFRLMN